MKKLSKLIPKVFLTLSLVGLLGLTSCGGNMGTETGNGEQDPTTNPIEGGSNPLAIQAALILDTLCETLSGADISDGNPATGCHQELAYVDCVNGVLPLDNIDEELGLEEVDSYQSIIDDEEDGLIKPEIKSATNCREDMPAQDCEGAWSPEDPQNFTNVDRMFSIADDSCSKTYSFSHNDGNIVPENPRDDSHPKDLPPRVDPPVTRNP